MKKTALVLVIITIFSNLLFSDDYLLYIAQSFQSDSYETHEACLKSLLKKSKEVKGDSAVIEMLFNEFEWSVDNPLQGASAADYRYLELLIVSVLGRVGKGSTADRLIVRLFETDNIVYVEQYITALANIGDDKNYNVTSALTAYFSVFDLTQISNNLEFCASVIYSLSILAEPKPLDIIEMSGLMDLIRLFTNEEIFSEKVVRYAKKRFVSTILDNL